MAVATSPDPKTAVPVFVMRLGDEGSFSIISDARSAGGGGFADPAIERLKQNNEPDNNYGFLYRNIEQLTHAWPEEDQRPLVAELNKILSK